MNNTVKVTLNLTVEIDAEKYFSDYDITRGQIAKHFQEGIMGLLENEWYIEKVTNNFA